MPNTNRQQTIFIDTGNPDTMNSAVLLRPGELGQAFDVVDRAYQVVQVDSGCTAATPAGVVAANEVAYWKNRSTYTVTNDSRFALLDNQASSFRNNIAGIFRNNATAGNYICVLQRGRQITVKEAGSGTGGELLISDTSTTAAQALGVAIGTAASCEPIGVIFSATSGANCVADIDIANIP